MTRTPVDLTVIMLTIGAMILGSCRAYAQDSDPNAELKWAVKKIEEVGGRVITYYDSEQESAFATVINEVGTISLPKTAIFFNSSLSDLDLAGVIEPLTKIPHLKKLNLSYTNITGRGLGALSGLKELTDLDLSSTPLNETGLYQLTQLCNLTNLQLNSTLLPLDGLIYFSSNFCGKRIFLYLANATVTKTTEQVRANNGRYIVTKKTEIASVNEWLGGLAKTKNVMTHFIGLDLSATGLTNEGLQALVTVVDKANFKKLVLAGNKLDNTGLTAIQQFSAITILDLADNTKITDAGLNNNLANFKSLTDLSLSGLTGVTDDGLSNLLNNNLNLINLNVSGTSTLLTTLKTPSSGCEAINKLRNLESLNVSKTGLADEGLKEIWKLRTMGISGYPAAPFANIKSFNIADTSVTDAGLIKSIRVSSKLFTITLGDPAKSGNKVTTGGINLLAALLSSQRSQTYNREIQQVRQLSQKINDATNYLNEQLMQGGRNLRFEDDDIAQIPQLNFRVPPPLFAPSDPVQVRVIRGSSNP